MKSWYYVIGAALVAYAVSVSLLVVRYEGRPGPPARRAAPPADEKAAPPGVETVAETTDASGPESWFSEDPEYPRNPNTELVSVDELLAPCDGGKRAENVVVFTADVNRKENGPRLVLASIDGKRWAYLGVEGEYSAFSPDGTKVAYRGPGGLCVINADGSGKNVLSGGGHALAGHHGRSFAFTPDGRAVVYTARIEEKSGAEIFYGIFLADVAGGSRRLIYSSEEPLSSPSLPASGEEIAFQKGRDIYVINVDGSALRRVTRLAEGIEWSVGSFPTFSPDGSKVSFRSGDIEIDEHEMAFDVYVVNADGTGRRNLTADDKRDERPHFSRDGKRIVFYSWEGGATVADVNTFELRRVPITGGTGSHNNYLTARFSPDDGKITYDPALGRTGIRQVYVINADGTGDTWISPGGKVWYEHPCFSPMRVDGVLLDTYGRVIEE